jgi:TfoX/Sxy family transcriptional regulator of competence genes
MPDYIPSDLRGFLEQVVSPKDEIEYKHMFGGMGAYAQGRIFASLSNVGLALKLTPADAGELLQLEGAHYLQYEPNAPISKHYVVLPDEVIKEPELLSAWVKRSIQHVITLPLPKKKSKK